MGALFVQTNTGTTSYHGVTFELQRRFRDGYGLHASYTTSDAETNVDSLANLSDLPENLDINMNGGDDTFSATGDLASLIGLTVDGGTGNDTILGSNGADVLMGGDGNDFIDGQQGTDVVMLGAGDDVFGHPLVVEVEERVVVDQDVPAPRAVLQLLDLGEEFAVVGEELVVRTPVALDQRVANEKLAGRLRVDPPVVDLPLRDDRYAVQRDLLVRHHRRLVLLPVRFAVRALQQMPGEGLDPLGLDLGVDARPET